MVEAEPGGQQQLIAPAGADAPREDVAAGLLDLGQDAGIGVRGEGDGQPALVRQVARAGQSLPLEVVGTRPIRSPPYGRSATTWAARRPYWPMAVRPWSRAMPATGTQPFIGLTYGAQAARQLAALGS